MEKKDLRAVFPWIGLRINYRDKCIRPLDLQVIKLMVSVQLSRKSARIRAYLYIIGLHFKVHHL